MKLWRNISEVVMPQRIAQLARDPRGYPIPANVLKDGLNRGSVIDFRVIDQEKVERLIERRCCALCGQPMGTRVAFVGGPRCMESRYFADAPMHRDCAIYALQMCPFLAAPSFGYRKSVHAVDVIREEVPTDRPQVFGMGICREFVTGIINGGHVVLRASPFESVSWWKCGIELDAGAAAAYLRPSTQPVEQKEGHEN